MTRIRGSVAALAVGLLLAGCGPDDAAPAAGGANAAGTAGATAQADDGKATAQADGGDATGQDKPGGGSRWCEAVKALTASIDPLFAQGAIDRKAEVDRAHARVKDLQPAAPAEIKTQVAALSEFYDAVIDTTGKSMAQDPAAYARLNPTMAKVKTALPPVSDYTMKHCPGLEKSLEQVGAS
ncbi:hypothetical protein ONA70_07120 [Micromonospora yasonensis]|uniref:hypothetical protein n=1 Tax=Micromonospora yasonensis TaxID=1128667 RepID=UPI00222E5093|nr:hypothetical protein [Micromonospora yasonensis]MCW3839867.1 hypothetical protein [Micromonospora yasonensis]